MDLTKFRMLNFSKALFLTGLVLMIGLTSCQQEEPIAAEVDNELVTMEAEIEATYEEVDEFTFEVMDRTDFTAEARPFLNPSNQLLPACATVTHDSINKIITIDFGTGCVGPDGKEREGQIIINYTQRLYWPGASLTISLNNYAVDDVQIKGTKTITNVSPNFLANISLNTTLVGGQVTWPNGDVATRQFTRTRTWVRAAHPINDEFHVDGQVQGTRRNGVAYNIDILSTLVFKRKCRLQGIHIPVEGTKLIQRSGKPDVLVTYGTGTCDHLIDVTVNGNTQTIDLSTL